MSAPDRLTGTVFNIQRLSTHDGPGLRTTAFLKGCPLSCRWCHNPEGMDPRWENGWDSRKCIGCGDCEAACRMGAVRRRADGGITLSHDLCVRCGACAAACPTGALTGYGRRFTPEQLCAELMKDEAYFSVSGGGVTFSGGEPLAQAAFVARTAGLLKARGVSVALDTCLYVSARAAAMPLPVIDIALVDIKAVDPVLHSRCTGRANERLFSNLSRYVSAARSGLRLFVRTPVVPGYTDGDANIAAIGRYLADLPEGTVEKWELILFHNLCAMKYAELERPWPLEGVGMLARADVARVENAARSSGFEPSRIAVAGLSEKE